MMECQSSSEGETSEPNSDGGEPSCVSMKSDRSMEPRPDLSMEGGESSCVSMKSDRSMEPRPDLSMEGRESSCVSMKSDRSMEPRPDLIMEGGESSCVSMKSDRSMEPRPDLSMEGRESSCVTMKSDRSMEPRPDLSREGGEPSSLSIKSDQLMETPPEFSGGPMPSDLQILQRHRTSMKNKYESLFEGTKTQENKTLLNRIYTQLYIIEGESEGVNEEHEVLQMERTPRRHLQNTPINCIDIFKPLQGSKPDPEEKNTRTETAEGERQNSGEELKGQKIRSVLTKGIAGIGKTVSVQKFILDWAEGKANQDVELMFVLPFRELNLIKDDPYSLHGLLCDFHPELKDLGPKIHDQIKAVFIFDGLDESRIPLDFEECEKVFDITMTSSVGVLMTNLIKGELLPSAQIWITSRPAAANQIPPKHINRVTEIQGFSDPQKEEYFRKRISDEDQAKRIISHIKTVRSLHIMCHIPVFCWISATVLQQIMKQGSTEISRTLTEMYSHFLLTQTHMKNEKYKGKDERDPKNLLESNRTILLKLAELAFKQLMKGNMMFYEEDLKESSIDATKASVYSGIFTEIFREACGLYQRKVYYFVHLSFQEFLAAVYVFHCFLNKNINPLQVFKPQYSVWDKSLTLDELLIGATEKALHYENGHLDLFLRFLLGISVASNQRLLQGLLKHSQSSSKKTTDHIKRLIKGDDNYHHISPDRSINLFLCLSEMKDQSLSKELQEYLNSENHSREKLSPGQCSALVCMLLMSQEVLDELDLKKYHTSEEGYKRLIPAITVSRKALLDGCFITVNSCETLCSALTLANLQLREMDLSNNDLQDSGVELLSVGLKNSCCKLEILRLAGCNLTTISCEKLTSVLQSENSLLKDLDLSNNDLQDSGVELLSCGLKSSLCKVEILRLAFCNLRENACGSLCSAQQSTNFSLKYLDLSNNDLQDSGVEHFATGLRSAHCNLEILRLSGCMVTDKGCSSLASALKSKPSVLKELDLTYNHPGESGKILLEDPHCGLDTLRVEHGGMIRIKPGLKKYSCGLILDPNTANCELFVSKGNRKAECVKVQPYPAHSDRFDFCRQVLCTEGLTGRCYWEVDCSGFGVGLAVTYKGISRKGHSNDCWFGYNDQSWCLFCSGTSYSAWHNNKEIAIADPPSSSCTVGVYLDWVSGTLSFYSILPERATHLHTFHTRFTEPLYPGFWVAEGASGVHVRDINC